VKYFYIQGWLLDILCCELFASSVNVTMPGDEIRIAGFGTFGISERGERQGRNPQTGAQITIAASKAAKFTAGKAVKDALNGG
jgi:nucleoid DNA-binding protein